MVIKCRLYTNKHILLFPSKHDENLTNVLNKFCICAGMVTLFSQTFWCFMMLCSPRFLFRLFTPLWMVSMWISVNFRFNPFRHEVNDSSICLRIYSIDAIMQSKRNNFIQMTRPTLNKLAHPPSWNDHSFSGTRQCTFPTVKWLFPAIFLYSLKHKNTAILAWEDNLTTSEY